MVDPNRMAKLHGIQQLNKGTLGQKIIAHKLAPLSDIGKQVTLRTELEHDKGTVDRVHDADQRDHAGVVAGQVVQSDLPLLELALSGIQAGLVERLDGIGDIGLNVDGGVYDAVGAYSKHAGELQPVGEQQAQSLLGSIAKGSWWRGMWRCWEHAGSHLELSVLLSSFFHGKIRLFLREESAFGGGLQKSAENTNASGRTPRSKKEKRTKASWMKNRTGTPQHKANIWGGDQVCCVCFSKKYESSFLFTFIVGYRVAELEGLKK